jgi:hypothetical protein
MVLIILRTTGVLTLTKEDEIGGIFRQYYRNSVVLPTKTLKALVQPGHFTIGWFTGTDVARHSGAPFSGRGGSHRATPFYSRD